jgi:peptide/nickel transport system substrate-binding protein
VPATGPYEVASFDPKQGLRLVRNARFREWSAAAQPRGFPDEIVELVKGSPDAHIKAVVDGSADVVSVGWNAGTPSPRALASVRTQHAGQLRLNPSKITWYLSLNTKIPPFDNAAARRAVNFAIDRQRLRDLTTGRELGVVTCQALPPSLGGYRRHCPYTLHPSKDGSWTAPDLERARRLVRTSGTAGQDVTFWIPRFTQFGAAAGTYVVQVLDSLGYRARYRYARSPLLDHVQMTVNGWSPDFAVPGGFIDPTLMCTAFLNLAAFCDPSIDRAIARAHMLHTTDPGAESQQWARIDRSLTDQAPWVPYANGIVLDVVSTRVGNYQHNPQWGTLLGQLWVR